MLILGRSGCNGDVYEPCTIEASYFFEVRVESGSAVDNFELGGVSSGKEDPLDRSCSVLSAYGIIPVQFWEVEDIEVTRQDGLN